MTTPGVRFVAIWTALSAAAPALGLAFSSMPWFRQGVAYMLLAAFAMAATPILQAIALRSAGFGWGCEWAVAGIAGAVAGRAVMDVLRITGVDFGAMSTLVYSMSGVTAVIVLQFLVLRRHGARAAAWIAAAVAGWAIERGAQWLVTGGLMAWQTATLSATAATALLEGLVLAWVVLPPVLAASTSARRSVGPGWHWLEWAASGAIAALTVMGTVGLLDAASRGSSRTGFTISLLLLSALAGLVIGGIQWLLLRGRVALRVTWMIVSVAALTVPFLLIRGAASVDDQELAMFVWASSLLLLSTPGGLAVVGAWFGFCQWLVLRRHAERAFLWIPASAIALLFCHLMTYRFRFSYAIGGAVAGAILACAALALRERAGARAVTARADAVL